MTGERARLNEIVEALAREDPRLAARLGNAPQRAITVGAPDTYRAGGRRDGAGAARMAAKGDHIVDRVAAGGAVLMVLSPLMCVAWRLRKD